MKIGTIKLKENVAPTLEDRAVDPKLKASLEAASWTADKAVKVSGYLGMKKSLLSASCKFQPILNAKLNFKVWLFHVPLTIFLSVGITDWAWTRLALLLVCIYYGN